MIAEQLKIIKTAQERAVKNEMSNLDCAHIREHATKIGLEYLAEKMGAPIRPTQIDKSGEFTLFVINPADPNNWGRFGEQFAKLLNKVPTRCGYDNLQKFVKPDDGWCLVHRFYAVKLLELAEKENIA